MSRFLKRAQPQRHMIRTNPPPPEYVVPPFKPRPEHRVFTVPGDLPAGEAFSYLRNIIGCGATDLMVASREGREAWLTEEEIRCFQDLATPRKPSTSTRG